MLRNFHTSITAPLSPLRCCLNSTGPGEVNLIASVIIAIKGAKMAKAMAAMSLSVLDFINELMVPNPSIQSPLSLEAGGVN